MKEKLTENEVGRICFERLRDNSERWCMARDELWQAIESDREAIREETREEMRKTHYEIGERAEACVNGEWRPGYVCVSDVLNVNGNVRRPPKTRPMTRQEKIKELESNGFFPNMWLVWNQLTDDTINNLMEVANLPTEVTTE